MDLTEDDLCLFTWLKERQRGGQRTALASTRFSTAPALISAASGMAPHRTAYHFPPCLLLLFFPWGLNTEFHFSTTAGEVKTQLNWKDHDGKVQVCLIFSWVNNQHKSAHSRHVFNQYMLNK